MKSDDEILQWLNAQWPPSVSTLHGEGTAFSRESMTLEMTFCSGLEFCHSGDIVQGGYITAMLDAAMAYAVIGGEANCEGVATLEIKANFIAAARNGEFNAIGKAVHIGGSIAYLDGQMFQQGKLVATATSTVKLLRKKS